MSETMPLHSLYVFISCTGTALSYVLREGRTCSFCRVIFLWDVNQQYGGYLKYFFYLSVCGFWHADEYLMYVQSAITDMATIRNFEFIISKR